MRERLRSCLGLATASVIGFITQSGTAVVAADDPIKAPYVEVGDCWSYRAEGLFWRGPIADFDECITFIDAARQIILMVATVKSDGRQIDTSYSLQWGHSVSLTGRVFSPPASLLKFPLLVGDTFSSECEFHEALRGANRGKQSWTSRVAGWEDVTVPAGTFRALRIDVKGLIERYDRPQEYPFSITLWYVPEVNRYVKLVSLVSGELSGWELTGFRLNK